MPRFFIQRDDGDDFQDVDIEPDALSMLIEGLNYVEAGFWKKGLRDLANNCDELRLKLEKLRDER